MHIPPVGNTMQPADLAKVSLTFIFECTFLETLVSFLGEPGEGGGVWLAGTFQEIFLMLFFTFLISVPKIGLKLSLLYSSVPFLLWHSHSQILCQEFL